MCGILGIVSENEKVVYDLVSGLTALQHRGQDAAGITTFDESFRTKKGLGLVNGVFEQKHMQRLNGNIGLAHNRYTTQGSNELINAQPFDANYPFGISMVHNGNLINFHELRKNLYEEFHILPNTSNDLELMLYSFATRLAESNDLKNLTVDDIFDAVEDTQAKVKGSYSTISIIAGYGLLAFTDPNGIRPMLLGEKKVDGKSVAYGIASESTCFDYIGYETIENIGPGQAIFINMNGEIFTRDCRKEKQHFCVFEYIYFAREDSKFHNKLVASERVKMGKLLARKVKESGIQPDIVVDVPSSAYFFASAMAEELDVPYRRGLVKNNHVGRSFIAPTQELREKLVRQKLNPIKDVVEGKKVAVVDDSIVRGTTSKRIVQILRNAGAKEVYFISAAPPIKHPCVYGIDMAISTELIASNKTNEEICAFIGADALIYQDLEDLQELYKEFGLCYACFSGSYPIEGSKQYLSIIEEERLIAKE